MTACPECGGPGGVLLLFTVAPCEGCSSLPSKKMMEQPRQVRYIPVKSNLPPRGAKRWAPGLMRPELWVRRLNRGEDKDTKWGWESCIPSSTIMTGIVDMGEDPDGWIDVPDGMDWGQR